MASEALEMMLQSVQAGHHGLETYATGYSQMYTGMMNPPLAPPVEPGPLAQPGALEASYGMNVVPYGDLLCNGGEVHDSFKVDRFENVYGGHTTLDMPETGKIHIDW